MHTVAKKSKLYKPRSPEEATAHEHLELKDVVKNTLEEARMVLPGIQALFGFQLVVVFNTTFKDIPLLDKQLHMTALLLSIVAIACLMAPAAYHRQVERDSISHHFVKYASKLLCFGMAPLLLSISMDAYVVSNVIFESSTFSLLVGVCSFILLLTLWYVVPHRARRRHSITVDEC